MHTKTEDHEEADRATLKLLQSGDMQGFIAAINRLWSLHGRDAAPYVASNTHTRRARTHTHARTHMLNMHARTHTRPCPFVIHGVLHSGSAL